MAYIAGVEHLKHNVMKAQDLRLGNLYMRGNKVEEFTDQVMHEVIYGALQHCEPIPLTQELLERFQFKLARKKKGTLGVYSNGKASVVLSTSGNVYTMRNKLIPYVHTFQNWYYYDQLTGEELTLTQ